MSLFDIQSTIARAENRLKGASRAVGRRPRSDRGTARIDARALAVLAEVAGGYERPRMNDLLASVDQRCRREGLKAPSRASIYKLLATLPTPTFHVAELPPGVQDALYNLTGESEVPAHQVSFYCFN